MSRWKNERREEYCERGTVNVYFNIVFKQSNKKKIVRCSMPDNEFRGGDHLKLETNKNPLPVTNEASGARARHVGEKLKKKTGGGGGGGGGILFGGAEKDRKVKDQKRGRCE